MTIKLAMFSYLVDNYDRAIDYFVNQLDFDLIEDTKQENKRWVIVAPKAAHSIKLLLAEAKGEKQISAIGNQFGGRVGFFLETDDFTITYEDFLTKGVHFIEEPRNETYGTVAVFEDLFGMRWDLIEYAKS